MQEFQGTLKNGKIPIGGCGVTFGGSSSAKYIVHCRGPIYSDIPGEGEAKNKTLENSLRMSVYTTLDTA